ncbi:hypothetical protein Tco_0978961 [Tanacetum coccineum]|uniref:Uncharacterized protein n=1 Tax=Tanacetum coccineum TaxID=301880 RepID=A0ABQ5EPC5_9ASTR
MRMVGWCDGRWLEDSVGDGARCWESWGLRGGGEDLRMEIGELLLLEVRECWRGLGGGERWRVVWRGRWGGGGGTENLLCYSLNGCCDKIRFVWCYSVVWGETGEWRLMRAEEGGFVGPGGWIWGWGREGGEGLVRRRRFRGDGEGWDDGRREEGGRERGVEGVRSIVAKILGGEIEADSWLDFVGFAVWRSEDMYPSP